MRLLIERTRCCGNLECVRLAPTLFAEDETGLGTVLVENPPVEFEALAREATEICPAAAISLIAD